MRSRRSPAGLAALVALALARPAAAGWNGPHEVVHGTAHTLESGEWMIGILTPIAYGINDQLTIVTHPVLWVLLTPNGGVRWKVFDTDLLALSLEVEGGRTVVDSDAVTSALGMPLGHVAGGARFSIDLAPPLMLTVAAGYQRDLSPDDDAITFSGGLTWLIGQSDLLMIQGGARASMGQEAVVGPSATLEWAHAWDNFRLGAGVAYGDFVIVRKDEAALRWPLWPVLDVWWRF